MLDQFIKMILRTQKEIIDLSNILPDTSKIYEKFMFNQMSDYFDSLFSILQCGFRVIVLNITVNAREMKVSCWQQNNKKTFGALLTGLSKGFDCLSHDLLIVNVNAYGLRFEALRLVRDYLSNRKQRAKIIEPLVPERKLCWESPKVQF